MDDDGDAAEVVMKQFVGRFRDVKVQTAATHGTKVQHVVELRRNLLELGQHARRHRNPRCLLQRNLHGFAVREDSLDAVLFHRVRDETIDTCFDRTDF